MQGEKSPNRRFSEAFSAKRNKLPGIILSLLALSLHARETDGGPRVLVRTSPASPLSGSAWTLTLLIEHPIPEEVDVLAPAFGESFFPDRILKSGRVLSADGEDVVRDSGMALHWTAVEYRFVLNSPGTYTIDSFTVISPRGKTLSPPINLSVRSSTGSPPYSPGIFWDNVPGTLRQGEEAVLQLRLRAGDSPSPAREIPRPGDLPGAALFMPPVPEGLILESEALHPAERGEGVLLRLRVIPLNISVLGLPARTVRHGNAVFEIPALRVPVSAAAGPVKIAPDEPAAADSAAAAQEAALPDAAAIPFPPFKFPRIPLPKGLAASCESLYAEANNLWDRGYRAEALAILRRNERDHPAGPLFAAFRREAERRLALTGTEDEKWRPGRLLPGLACVTLAAVLFFSAAFFGGRKKRLVFAVFFLFTGLIFMYNFAEGSMFRRARRAVARETVARRAPDPEGTVTARFAEGLPVKLGPQGSAAGGAVKGRAWIWAEDFRKEDGDSEGWVSVESLVFY